MAKKNEEMNVRYSIDAASLQTYFEKYPNASIRKLAAAANVTYGLLLKKSKEPIPGQAYDPDATNWDALEQYLLKRSIHWDTLDWDAMNEVAARAGGVLAKSVDDFEVGSKVWLRKNNEVPYTAVYKTATHIVVMLDGTTEPQALSNNTFILYGPSKQQRAPKEVEEQ